MTSRLAAKAGEAYVVADGLFFGAVFTYYSAAQGRCYTRTNPNDMNQASRQEDWTFEG